MGGTIVAPGCGPELSRGPVRDSGDYPCSSGSVFVSSGTETTHSGQSSTDDGESLDVQQACGITEEPANKNRKKLGLKSLLPRG